MPHLSPEQVETVVRRLDFLRLEVQDIPRFESMTQAEYTVDRDRRRSLERLVENVVNAAADIAKVVLAAGDFPLPDTYRDAMLQLGIAGVLPPDLAGKLAEMTRLRNVLAHQYLDIRWASLQSFIREAPGTFRVFIDQVERLLEESQ